MKLPKDSRRWLEQPATESKLAACRRSVDRGAPFGSPAWQKTTAETLGLGATLRPRGRPRKVAE
jgi:putative transposase